MPTIAHTDSLLSCVGRPREGIGSCLSTSIDQIESRKAFNLRLGEMSGKDFTFLDPFQALCDEQICLNINGSKPLYTDRTHLSIWGSRLLIATFQDSFNFTE